MILVGAGNGGPVKRADLGNLAFGRDVGHLVVMLQVGSKEDFDGNGSALWATCKALSRELEIADWEARRIVTVVDEREQDRFVEINGLTRTSFDSPALITGIDQVIR